MAVTVQFRGSNTQFVIQEADAKDGTDTGFKSFFGFVSRCKTMTHTLWLLSPEEIAEIVKTGVVMVSFKNHGRPLHPMWVGSRKWVLAQTLEFGGMWSNEVKTFKPTPGPRQVSVNFDFRDWMKSDLRSK